MSVLRKPCLALLAGLLLAFVCGSPAMADDTELFLYNSSQLAIPPNILLILDTSGSMTSSLKTQLPYDPTKNYSGSCPSGRVYWWNDDAVHTDPPACSSNRWFDLSKFECKAGSNSSGGVRTGRFTDYLAQYDPDTSDPSNPPKWISLNQNNDHDWYVECQDDSGHYGLGNDTTEPYAQNGTSPWGSNSGNEIQWHHINNYTYTVYDSNYLNWYWYSSPQWSTRSTVVKAVAKNLLRSINGVNIGLMRYNWYWWYDQNGNWTRHFYWWQDRHGHWHKQYYGRAHGGRLVHAISDISTSRNS